MAYTVTPYATIGTVKRLLRVVSGKVRIGDNPNDHMTIGDAEEFINDASLLIDSMLMTIIKAGQVPLVNYTLYPEVIYSAPRISAFLIYRSLYSNYKIEDLPPGPRGWFTDAQDNLKKFIENIESGVYTTLSPATDGPGWITAYQTFQNLIGVKEVHDQVANVTNRVPIQTENIGPYTSND